MVHGFITGLLILAVLAYYLGSGISFYSSLEGRHGPMGFYLAAFLVLAWSIGVFGIRSLRISRIRRWPHVVGIIQDVEARRDGWRLSYTYRVNDTPYRNDVYDVEARLADPSALALRYTKTSTIKPDDLVDRRVAVYFDPEDPGRSALSRSGEPSPWLLAIPAAVSLAACGLMTFIMLSAIS